MFRLDHAIIAVNDLEAAIADYTELGFTVIRGGEHASGTTHNALINLQDGSYIELLAATGKPPKPDVNAADFTSMLANGEGLVGYALLSDDLVADITAMRERGVAINDPAPGKRLRPDGVALRWQSAMLPDSISPFFIQDETPRNLRVSDDPKVTTHENEVTGISLVTIIVPDVEIQAKSFADLLGHDPIRVRADEATFDLAGTPLNIILPENQSMRVYADARGNAPYQLNFTIPDDGSYLLNLNRAHQARLILGSG